MISSDERARALNWLYDEGNPVLKLWAAERLGVSSGERARLRGEMLRHPAVQYWLDCLLGFADHPALHGRADACLENSMRKALLFGVREEDEPRLAKMNAAILAKLPYQREHPHWLNPVDYTIMASYLAAMGHAERPVIETIRERIRAWQEFVSPGGCDMYADPAGYPAMPAVWRNRPLIHPKYSEGNRYRYPLVYDLFAFANLPPALAADAETARMTGNAIGIVLDERYQRLPWGYGIIFVPPNRYYSMGWSIHLSRFFNEEESRKSVGGAVWWAEAMARYPVSARSDWFRRIIAHLSGFRSKDGFWKFPAAYLTEGTHYFVSAGHMGLGENRKDKNALRLESTAWMLRIAEAQADHIC